MAKNKTNEENNKFYPDFLIIPYPVIVDTALQPLDLKTYGVVYWMERLRNGRCTASNKTIAKFIGSSTGGVVNSLTRLQRNGYIKTEFNEDEQRVCIKTQIHFTTVNEGGTSTHAHGVHETMDRRSNTKRENNYGYRDDVTEENFRKIADILQESYRIKFLDERKRKFNARLATFTIDEILTAARALNKSSFHMGDNPDKKKYANFDFLMRNDSQVDKWLNMESSEPAPGWSFQNKKRKDEE